MEEESYGGKFSLLTDKIGIKEKNWREKSDGKFYAKF
jgi:hypothetical protein